MVVHLNLASLVSFWDDQALLVPAAALVVALGWTTRLRQPLAVGTSLLAALWLSVAFTPLTSWMARGLVRSDPVRRADAVFVFSSRMQRDADPTSDSLARLLRGVELVAEGRAPTLILSELPPPERSLPEYARPLLLHLHLSPEVLVVGPVRNTRDEAVAVADVFRARGWHRVLAVTSPTHTARASATLEAMGLEVVSVPSLETRFDLETLDRPMERVEAFGTVIHERLGRFVYRRRGWVH